MSTVSAAESSHVVSHAVRTRKFDSTFQVQVVSGLKDATFSTLLQAFTGGPLVIQQALDSLTAAKYAAGFEDLRSANAVDSYAPDVIGHAALHLAPALFDTYDDPVGAAADYVRQERNAQQILTHRFGHDPRMELQRILSGFDLPVRPARATLPGAPIAGAGLVRDLREGSLLHWDNIQREAPGLLRDLPLAIGTINVFCSVPQDGGAVVVHDQEWRVADEDFRYKYGYKESVADRSAAVRLNPAVGDAIIFRSAQLHQVVPSTVGSRWTLSCFFGLVLGADLHLELVVWG